MKEWVKVTRSIEDEDGGLGGPYYYQWKRAEVPIAAAANQSTYTLVQDDVGKTITVEVSYEDAHGNNEMLESAETGSVANTNDVAQGRIEIEVFVVQSER